MKGSSISLWFGETKRHRLHQDITAYPRENSSCSGVPESGTKPRNFSFLHLDFLNHKIIYVCNKFKKKSVWNIKELFSIFQATSSLSPAEVTLKYTLLGFSYSYANIKINYFLDKWNEATQIFILFFSLEIYCGHLSKLDLRYTPFIWMTKSIP